MNTVLTTLSKKIGTCITHLGLARNMCSQSVTSLSSPQSQNACSSLGRRISCLTPSLKHLPSSQLLQPRVHGSYSQSRNITFEYMHRTGSYSKVKKKKKTPLDGNPQLKGVVLKTLVKKPKKPNSANRKCVRLRLSNGKEVTAYVPGEGHNLQEHNIVLVEGGKLQDTPGVKLVCVRGKYDLPHVKKKTM